MKTDCKKRCSKATQKIIKNGKKSDQFFAVLAETYQALGDSSRIQIVWTLSHGALCVGNIADLLGMSQPKVSHHLRSLRNLKLVKVQREGRQSWYSLDDEHIEGLLKEGMDHVEDLLR